MGYRKRIVYTESKKTLLWDRWKNGESLQQIAQLFDRNHSSVSGILSVSGGIRPPQRKCGGNAMNVAYLAKVEAMITGTYRY